MMPWKNLVSVTSSLVLGLWKETEEQLSDVFVRVDKVCATDCEKTSKGER